ncbi:MAG: hypothetical protein IJB96_06490 [Lachnospira sp.]|nr:hypothetical protein [Lachnospira sp.]
MNNRPEVNKIQQLISNLESITKYLYMGKINEAQGKINETLPGVSSCYTYLIDNAIRYGSMGVEVPVDVLAQHICNMNDAMNNNDLVALTDTFQYEIREGLAFLEELVRQEIQEGEA